MNKENISKSVSIGEIIEFFKKIDLDSLPDVQKCVENENNNEESMNCSGEPIAS